jgi:hypothetical protein
MRFLRGCLLFLALDSVVLLCLAGVAVFFLTGMPASVQNLPPPVTSPDKALALESKLNQFSQELEDANAAGEREHMSLVITEEEANSLIARDLPAFQEQNPGAIPLRIESVQVSFWQGKVLAAAVVDLTPLRPRVAIVARVHLKDGRPSVEIERIDVGRLPTPLLAPAVEDYIRQAVDPGASGLPLIVDTVQIADGELIMDGWSKPSSP